jgi:hypothetical protein
MAAGRPPHRSKHARTLKASSYARERLEVILGTLSGERTVGEACEELGISEARFHQIRKAALQAAAERLEPGRTGRPPREQAPEAERIAELEAALELKEVELRAAEVRAELALAMPNVLQARAPKKTTPRGTKTKAKLALPRRGRKRKRNPRS